MSYNTIKQWIKDRSPIDLLGRIQPQRKVKMSVEEIKRTQVVGHKAKCDVCWETNKDIANSLCHDNIHICVECRIFLPDELVDAISKSRYPKEEYSWNWQSPAALSFLYSIRDSSDSFDYKSRLPSDLKVGVWIVVGNGEAENYEVVRVSDMESLERVVKRFEFDYRDYPRYLEGVLVDGTLRHFVSEWSLIEIAAAATIDEPVFEPEERGELDGQ